MADSAIVECATCGMPGRVIFAEGTNTITAAFFVCKCPRPSVEEANAANEEKK